jgi:uncharacterized protein YkwD/uncharacterized protein YgiM (DUF1202 family)
MSFNLVRYSQQDPVWKNIKLGDSNYTIGTSGCTLTSMAMYLSGFGYAETPQTLNKKLLDEGGFMNGALVWGVVSTLYPQVKFDNLIICRDSDAPLSQIDSSIAAGQPVIVEVDSSPAAGLQTHWVVLYAKNGADYLMLDPWPYPVDGSPVTLGSRYSYGKSIKRSITAVAFYQSTPAGEGTPGTTPPATVETNMYIQVIAGLTDPGLRLRAGPSTSTAILGHEASGTRLHVIEPESTAQPKVGVYDQWIHVRDPNGMEGYVAAWYIELTSPPAPQPPPTTPPQPDTGSTTAPTAQALIDAVNTLRTSRGLTALASSPILMSISQQHANYMASGGGVTHNSADGSRPFQRALAADYPLAGDLSQGGFLSENIMSDTSNNVQDIVDGWLADAPHTETMLSAAYKEIGAGIAVSAGLIYYCIDCALPTVSTTEPQPPTTPPAPWIPPSPSTPPAPELYIYVSPAAGSAGLRLRRLPDTTSAVLRVLPVGEKLKLLDDERVLNNRLGVRNKFFKVLDKNGTFGYVAAWLVQKDPVETPAPPETPPSDTTPSQPPSTPPASTTPEEIIIAVSASVGSGGTVLRRQPGPAGVIIRTLSVGEQLTVLEDERAFNNKIGIQNKYLKVTDSNGKLGYVAAWLVQRVTADAGGTTPEPSPSPTPAPAEPPPTDSGPSNQGGLTVVVLASVSDGGLRMRAQATTYATVVSIEPPGAQLTVLDNPDEARPKIGVRNQWLWVQDRQGRSGYIAAWLVEEANPATGGPPAGGTSDASGATDSGAPLTVHVSSLASPGLRLRAQPNTASAIIKTLAINTPLTVLDLSLDAESKIGVFNQWLKVREPAGEEGYVAAWYVVK